MQDDDILEILLHCWIRMTPPKRLEASQRVGNMIALSEDKIGGIFPRVISIIGIPTLTQQWLQWLSVSTYWLSNTLHSIDYIYYPGPLYA